MRERKEKVGEGGAGEVRSGLAAGARRRGSGEPDEVAGEAGEEARRWGAGAERAGAGPRWARRGFPRAWAGLRRQEPAGRRVAPWGWRRARSTVAEPMEARQVARVRWLAPDLEGEGGGAANEVGGGCENEEERG